MKIGTGIKLSVIYASFLAAISLYFGLGEVLVSFSVPLWYLFPISFTAFYPLAFLLRYEDWLYSLLTIPAFLASLGVAISSPYIPGDIMGGFVLILISALLFASLRGTYEMFYDGLSFYIVGTFLLLADAFIQISILLADVADYYINCIGEKCKPYGLEIRPEVYLFFLALMAVYPFFVRHEFKRREG